MSARENALSALKNVLTAALPGADVKRNVDVLQSVGPGGLAVLRDGDLGEPEVSLSPALYAFEHRAELELYIDRRDGAEAILDALLADIGAALAADPTLGGAVDHCEPTAPTLEPLSGDGGDPLRVARLSILLIYVTASPLG